MLGSRDGVDPYGDDDTRWNRAERAPGSICLYDMDMTGIALCIIDADIIGCL